MIKEMIKARNIEDKALQEKMIRDLKKQRAKAEKAEAKAAMQAKQDQ